MTMAEALWKRAFTQMAEAKAEYDERVEEIVNELDKLLKSHGELGDLDEVIFPGIH